MKDNEMLAESLQEYFMVEEHLKSFEKWLRAHGHIREDAYISFEPHGIKGYFILNVKAPVGGETLYHDRYSIEVKQTQREGYAPRH